MRKVVTLVFAVALLGTAPTAYTLSSTDPVLHDCRDAYTSKRLPDATAALLALQHQCELELQHNNRRRMDVDLVELRLALLRLHIALHSVTATDRALPKTIDPMFAGDAAAILATIYKGNDSARYESAIIRAAWLAAKSEVPLAAAEAAIREAIVIYVRRGDYVSAGKLIQHLKEPVLSNQTENGQLLIDLLQGDHGSHIRDAITNIAAKWGSDHVAIVGPIDYVIAETYKSADKTEYIRWLNVAEGNDFKPASVELRHRAKIN